VVGSAGGGEFEEFGVEEEDGDAEEEDELVKGLEGLGLAPSADLKEEEGGEAPKKSKKSGGGKASKKRA
jgi:hypothetical protein